MKIASSFTISFGIPSMPVIKEPDALDCLLDNTKVQWGSTNGLQVSIAGEEIPVEALVQIVGEMTANVQEYQ